VSELNHKQFWVVLAVSILVVQNIAIFWNHYFNGLAFPWDFWKGWYAMIAFWISAVNIGTFPMWQPFQAMGFPMVTDPQSNIFYPPFWLFPIFSIEYTLHLAVVFQIIHVLFGSIGMFFFLKHVLKDPRYAIVGSFAFQFFGGFYNNAEHPDIVRAFALVPWLLYAITLDTDHPKLTKKVMLIPVFVYLLFTGGYPGIYVASAFILSIFIISQIINNLRKRGKKNTFFNFAIILGLIFLGIGISSIYLGPIWQERNEITRFSGLPQQDYWGMENSWLATFFMSNATFVNQERFGMSSTFLTLPIILFFTFTPISAFKRYWMFSIMLFVGILMIFGPNSPFWVYITNVIPVLHLSRFPVNDYRIFVSVPIILFALCGLRHTIEKKYDFKNFIVRSIIAGVWFYLGIHSLYGNNFNQQENTAIIIFVASLAILFYNNIKSNKLFKTKELALSYVGLSIILVIIAIDGTAVIFNMPTWTDSGIEERYAANSIPLTKDGKLVTFYVITHMPNERPSRISTENISPYSDRNYSWEGWLTGNFMMWDYGGFKLTGNDIVASNKIYQDYMYMKWTPIFLPNITATQIIKDQIKIPDSEFVNIHSAQNDIEQIRYGINEISYKINLKAPTFMVENELYFPGWKAELIDNSKKTIIDAVRVNDVFRGWYLPAGNYGMKAFFEFPNFDIYKDITIFMIVIWGVSILNYKRIIRNNE